MDNTNFWSKLWSGIKYVFSKIWVVAIVPLSLFLVKIFFNKDDKIEEEIKETKEEIKESKKDLKKQEEVVEKVESNVVSKNEETKDMIEEVKESEEKRKEDLSKFLPGLKR